MYDTNTDPSLLKGHTTAPSKFPNFAALATVVMFPYQEKMFPYQEKYSWGQLIRQTNESLFPVLQKKDEEEEQAGLGRILKMNAPEWPFILFGSLGAIINGGAQPAFAIIFSEILGVS